MAAAQAEKLYRANPPALVNAHLGSKLSEFVDRSLHRSLHETGNWPDLHRTEETVRRNRKKMVIIN